MYLILVVVPLHWDICLDYPKIISEKWNLAVNFNCQAKEQKSSPYLLLLDLDLVLVSSSTTDLQCIPIKRKPVLSVRYLHCHARLKQTSLYASFSRAFSLSFDTKYKMISQCINEREQFKLMHVKNDLRRNNGVELI